MVAPEHLITDAEEETIERLAKIAAETVVKKRRTKLVTYVALGTAIVTFGISIPVSKIVFDANAHINCQLITALAGVDEEKALSEKPATERFERLSKDRFGLTQSHFEELVARTQAEQQHRLKITRRVAHHVCS